MGDLEHMCIHVHIFRLEKNPTDLPHMNGQQRDLDAAYLLEMTVYDYISDTKKKGKPCVYARMFGF